MSLTKKGKNTTRDSSISAFFSCQFLLTTIHSKDISSAIKVLASMKLNKLATWVTRMTPYTFTLTSHDVSRFDPFIYLEDHEVCERQVNPEDSSATLRSMSNKGNLFWIAKGSKNDQEGQSSDSGEPCLTGDSGSSSDYRPNS